MNQKISDKEIREEIKKIVIARIDVAPSNFKLSIGFHGSLTKEEMKEHIKKDDETGKQIINSHIRFIKALANGEFVKAISSAEI